jgi:triosephosphate isomerase
MHMTCAETREFAAVFRPLIADLPSNRQVVLAPPFTSIPTLCRHLEGAGVAIAGQNVHWEESGAYTGMISGPMLIEHGVTHAIVGHSEPRTMAWSRSFVLARALISARPAKPSG